MNNQIRTTAWTLALALLAPMAATAGWYYEATTVTESDQAAMDSDMTVRVWVEGDSTKIEFAEGDQDPSGFFGPGSYMLTTDAGETTYLVNTEEQTYSSFNMGQMMNTMSQVMEGMGGMFKIEFADLSSEKISEGPGESILGYDTKHVQYRTGYTMRMAIMGMKQENRVDMTQDMWVTDAFDPRAFAVWLRPDKRMQGMIEGLDELMEAEFSKMDGVPLRGVMVQNTTDKKGRTTTMTTTTEVQALREEAVTASTFEIPAGYTETEIMPDMSQLEGMQAGQQEEEGSEDGKRKRPRLRDLLKGDGSR